MNRLFAFSLPVLAAAGVSAASAARLPSDPMLEVLVGGTAETVEAEVPDTSAQEGPVEPSGAVRLVLRGGFGMESGDGHDDDDKFAGNAELAFPVAGTFDASLRAFGLFGHDYESQRVRRTRTYRTGRRGLVRYYYYDESQYLHRRSAMGGSAFFVWRPLRGAMLEPFAGAGAGAARMHPDSFDADSGESPETKFGIALRAGATFRPFGRLALTAEGLLQGDVTELVAEAAFRVSDTTWIHAFCESFDADVTDGTVFGGGLSFAF